MSASLALVGKPDCCIPHDLGRGYVAAFEFVIAHLVCGAFESGTILRLQESIGTHPSWVPCKKSYAESPTGWYQEIRREGEHVREQVAVAIPSERT